MGYTRRNGLYKGKKGRWEIHPNNYKFVIPMSVAESIRDMYQTLKKAERGAEIKATQLCPGQERWRCPDCGVELYGFPFDDSRLIQKVLDHECAGGVRGENLIPKFCPIDGSWLMPIGESLVCEKESHNWDLQSGEAGAVEHYTLTLTGY